MAILAEAGYEVVASTGKSAEHAYLQGLGAARVLGRTFVEDDGRTLGPQLWAGVVDCVGGRLPWPRRCARCATGGRSRPAG